MPGPAELPGVVAAEAEHAAVAAQQQRVVVAGAGGEDVDRVVDLERRRRDRADRAIDVAAVAPGPGGAVVADGDAVVLLACGHRTDVGEGAERRAVLRLASGTPLPSWLAESLPQEYGTPAALTASEKRPPAEMRPSAVDGGARGDEGRRAGDAGADGHGAGGQFGLQAEKAKPAAGVARQGDGGVQRIGLACSRRRRRCPPARWSRVPLLAGVTGHGERRRWSTGARRDGQRRALRARPSCRPNC